MKILAILTGGTIGSGVINGFISLDNDIKSKLLNNRTDVEIDTIQPYNILSEQLDGEYLQKLVECVGENINIDYDGIIITHGTDTLQYSACALSCVYGDAKIPIVLVSSNYVLEDERANGKDNFRYAVEFIKEKIGGVFVSYKNTGGKPEIHQGHKVMPHEIYTDDVKSINGAFGYFENNKFIENNSFETVQTISSPKLNKTAPILWLKIHPGMALPDTKGYKAILLEAYHSGTAPTLSPTFREFCQNAEMPFYMVGAKEGPQYDSVKEYSELSIYHLPFISPIYAYMCLWFMADGEIDFNRAFDILLN